MGFPRRIEPEWLDVLPADDPVAIQSRRDLRRLNALLGHHDAMARWLKGCEATRRMRRVVDLGAGDGTFLLEVARRLTPPSRDVQAVLVDRQAVVSPTTREAFAKLGWKIEAAKADVFDWLQGVAAQERTAIVTNLFLHHFEEAPLRALLAQLPPRAELFVACEPRRSRLALGASRLVGCIGCNAVTRHDATISVRAGFTGREISTLWPECEGWSFEERAVGPFGHLFAACRRE